MATSQTINELSEVLQVLKEMELEQLTLSKADELTRIIHTLSAIRERIVKAREIRLKEAQSRGLDRLPLL